MSCGPQAIDLEGLFVVQFMLSLGITRYLSLIMDIITLCLEDHSLAITHQSTEMFIQVNYTYFVLLCNFPYHSLHIAHYLICLQYCWQCCRNIRAYRYQKTRLFSSFIDDGVTPVINMKNYLLKAALQGIWLYRIGEGILQSSTEQECLS